jgi:hypothetical protein
MAMDDELPSEIAEGATLQGGEYGWSVPVFPRALSRAEVSGYACLGGQFQFRIDDDSTCEMYWLNADSNDRTGGESWAEYSHRSCSEVLQKFQLLVNETDFGKEAASWPFQIDPIKNLVSIAYFVREPEWVSLSAEQLK